MDRGNILEGLQVLVLGDECAVGAAAQHTVYDDGGLGPGHQLMRAKGAVCIALDLSLIHI